MSRLCRLLSVALVSLPLSAALGGFAPVLYVDDDAPPGGGGQSWNTAFNDLQDALDVAALSGDVIEIWVAAGTYRPDRATYQQDESFELQNNLVVYGGFAGNEQYLWERTVPDNPTILSGDLLEDDGPGFANMGDNSLHVVTAIGTDGTAVLDGFIVQGGNAGAFGGDDSLGGGVLVKDGAARVVGCRFNANQASFGGALACRNASPMLMACSFVENAASTVGGAIFNLDTCAPVVIGCMFSHNSAGLQGGALASTTGCDVTVLNSVFCGNEAMSYGGGAVLNNTSQCLVVNSVFSGNVSQSAAYGGGALRNERGNLRLINSTLVGNAANAGGGVYYAFPGSEPVLDNCILWANTAGGVGGELAQLAGDGGSATVNYCCVDGWTGGLGGEGNCGSDPNLVDPDGADNVLGTVDDLPRIDNCASPCADAGDNNRLPLDTFDLDDDGDLLEPIPLDVRGGARIVAGVVDIGAYESIPSTCRAGDMDCDGDVDFDDINPFVLALSGPDNYYAEHPNCNWSNADCDFDLDVDFDDINPFVALIGT